MTDVMSNDERAMDFARRFTPQLVDLNAHGSSITCTVLLNGQYYTASNIRPDFTAPSDDAVLRLPVVNSNSTFAMLSERREAVGILLREDRCERWLIDNVLKNGQVMFRACWRSYLMYVGLDDVEPSNRSYYDAIKLFVGVWHRLSELLASA